MSDIYFILPALLAIFVSYLVVRASAIALMMTGLDRKRAVFQAISAFTGTGFTTREAETVINNPMRRKIISWLMIFGNAGIVTVIITATSSLVSSRGYHVPLNVIIFIVGIFVIYKIGTHQGFIQKWEKFIEGKLVKSPAFEEGAVEDLLHLMEGYGLVRVRIKEDSPLVDASLSECKVGRGELVVLGIEREKEWVTVPKLKEKIKEGDRLVVYGPLQALRSLFKEGLKCP